MDARTPVDETSGPPGGRCAGMLELSFFGNPSPQHTHRRISHSLLQSHGFVARDPFDPVALLSLVHSDELSSLCPAPHEVAGSDPALAGHSVPASPAPSEVVGSDPALAGHPVPASPAPSEVVGSDPALNR